MRRLTAAAVTLLVLGACFGSDSNLTESGKGKPSLSAEVPDTVSPGAPVTATLTVENPGPGDMASVVVAFAAVGQAAASGPLPVQLVPVTSGRDEPVVRTVVPEPERISPDGVVYVFGGLPEGETMEIAFEIAAPEAPGLAANSVSVYDGAEPDRITGLRLETLVTG